MEITIANPMQIDPLNLPSFDQQNWLKAMGGELEYLTEQENGIILKQSKILWLVSEVWPCEKNQNKETVTLEAVAPWDYDFYIWAKSYTKMMPDREPAEITIDNKISVHRDWEEEQVIEYPAYVVIEDKREKFDLSQVPYGKRLVARGKARRGEMNDKDWAALANPKVTVGQLKQVMKNEQKSNSDFALVEKDGIIYAFENGKRVAIYQRIYDDFNEPLYQKAIGYFLKVFGQSVREVS